MLYIADSVPFGEGLSMKYTKNMKHYLFIAIIIAETQQNLFIVIQFRHIAFIFSESDVNRTRKSEVNKQITDFIKEYLKHMYMYLAMQLLNKLQSINDSN